jgi:hypothetical protein
MAKIRYQSYIRKAAEKTGATNKKSTTFYRKRSKTAMVSLLFFASTGRLSKSFRTFAAEIRQMIR